MKTITRERLRTILASVQGATPVTILAVTDARLKKTGNPHAVCYKVAQVNGMCGTDHESAVMRQQVREGSSDPNYQAGDRSWGTRISAALIENKGEFYVPVQMNPRSRVHPIYLVPKMQGIKVRLTPVPKTEIAAFLPADRRAETQALQGVERTVERRDFRLDSIAQIAIGGEKMRVRS